jgi:hypothetical protein
MACTAKPGHCNNFNNFRVIDSMFLQDVVIRVVDTLWINSRLQWLPGHLASLCRMILSALLIASCVISVCIAAVFPSSNAARRGAAKIVAPPKVFSYVLCPFETSIDLIGGRTGDDYNRLEFTAAHSGQVVERWNHGYLFLLPSRQRGLLRSFRRLYCDTGIQTHSARFNNLESLGIATK